MQRRGIDLVRWFTPDDENDKKLALTKGDLLLTKEQFTKKLNGLGLGLGAGQDQDTQQEIANAISKGSIDTCCRKKNCDANSPHISGAARMSIKTLLEVAKVENSLTGNKVNDIVAAATASPQRTAMAARKDGENPVKSSPPKARTPVVVDVPPIKPAPPIPFAQKPLWSPSAVQHQKKATNNKPELGE